MIKLSESIGKRTLIDKNTWKTFVVGRLFQTPKIKKYSKIPKAIGTIPFVSSKSTDNGIASKCNYNPEISKAITVSTNGNNFDCFYHEYAFVPSTDVEVLVNQNLNKYNALFICSILNLESKKYSFSKKAKNNAVQNTIISLPVDQYGNPDWKYMEAFMRERERAILRKL